MNKISMESMVDIQTVYCETMAEPALWTGLGVAVASNYLRYITHDDVKDLLEELQAKRDNKEE